MIVATQRLLMLGRGAGPVAVICVIEGEGGGGPAGHGAFKFVFQLFFDPG